MAPNTRKPISVTDTADLEEGGLTVAVIAHGDVAVLTVRGSIDLLTVPQLTKAVDESVAGRPAGLIIDLTYTDFLSSVGMSALINAHDAISPSGRFAVVADGPSTSRPIKLVGLDQTLTVYATMSEALDGIAQQSASQHVGRASA